jgi:D-ribulokinase
MSSLTSIRVKESYYYVGIDLGTSGARISIVEPIDANDSHIDEQTTFAYAEVYSRSIGWNEIIPSDEVYSSVDAVINDTVRMGSYDEPKAWSDAVHYLFAGASSTMTTSKMQQVRAICISGTSSSCLLVGPTNSSMTGASMEATRGSTARMYNYAVTNDTVQQFLKQYVPDRHTAQSATGTLAKLLLWHVELPIQQNERLCHQSDYLSQQWLHTPNGDSFSIYSDWHNCLKLGYDVQSLQWPSWLLSCLQNVGLSTAVLPKNVTSPGAVLGTIQPKMATKYGLSESTVIVGGTTDSNAAFFAATQGSQILEPGIAVTSLGSTVALKLLSTTHVEDAICGVYSHRFPSTFQSVRNETDGNNNDNNNDNKTLWLVGGASNVGCAILRHLNYSNDELDDLSNEIDPNSNSPHKYYPLLSAGERFPIADRNKEPIVTPIPNSRREYLHGLLQGISDVERDGYIALGTLGAQPSIPNRIWTCGGGSRNGMWNSMRQRRLNEGFIVDQLQRNITSSVVMIQRASNVEASYGAAVLAASSFRSCKS